jgi:hypothetical protein
VIRAVIIEKQASGRGPVPVVRAAARLPVRRHAFDSRIDQTAAQRLSVGDSRAANGYVEPVQTLRRHRISILSSVARTRRRSSTLAWLSVIVTCVFTTGFPLPTRADDACVRFSDLDSEELAHFDFDADAIRIDDFPEHERFVIDEINVVRQPIFDVDRAGEDRWLYRMANALHANTRESAIRSALLFEDGDEVPGRVLAESERELRRREYLYDARVVPRIACDERLHVDVVVRDVWTLLPDVNVSRSGGESRLAVGVAESNVLGTGKSLTFRLDRDEDRDSAQVLYADHNVLGTRVTLDVEAATTDDGTIAIVDIQRPFYSLEARQAVGAHGGRTRLEEGLFFRSDEIASFTAERRRAGFFAGTSEGIRDGIVLRWLTGIEYEEDRFSIVPDEPAPDPLPVNRRRVYPWIGIERIRPLYARDANIDHIYRTEDVFVGTELSARLGLADEFFGADSSRLIMRAEFAGGRLLDLRARSLESASDRHLLSYGMEFEGEFAFDQRRIEHMLAHAQLRYRYRQTDHMSVAITANVSAARRLPVDRQLLLGGDTGLRGYPNRYQVGDRAWQVTVEQRYFSPAYPWRLFRVGAAVFVDVGRAWFPGDPHGDGFGVLANVGAGLRIDPTRAWRDRVLHIDISRPLRGGPQVQGWELTLTGRHTL